MTSKKREKVLSVSQRKAVLRNRVWPSRPGRGTSGNSLGGGWSETDGSCFLGCTTSTSHGMGWQHRLFRGFEVCWYVGKCSWSANSAFMTHTFPCRRYQLHCFKKKSVYVEKVRRRHKVVECKKWTSSPNSTAPSKERGEKKKKKEIGCSFLCFPCQSLSHFRGGDFHLCVPRMLVGPGHAECSPRSGAREGVQTGNCGQVPFPSLGLCFLDST